MKKTILYHTLAKQTFAIWLIQMIILVIPMLDTYFLIGISNQNVASYALGSSFYGLWILVCKGILQGISFRVAVIANVYSHDNQQNLAIQSLYLVVILTLIAWMLLYLSGIGIQHLPISDTLKHLSWQYLYIAMFGVPAVLGVRALSAWYQGVSLAGLLAKWFIIGIIIKVFLTKLFIMGVFGQYWQNISGVVFANNLMFWFIFFALLISIRQDYHEHNTSYTTTNSIHYQLNIHEQCQILHYGLPIGIAYWSEFSIVPMITSLIASHNEHLLVIHEILSSVYDWLMSLPIAAALASSILAGQLYQYNFITAKYIKSLCDKLLIGFCIMLFGLVWAFKYQWLSLYDINHTQTSLATSIIPVILLRAIVESLQTLSAFHLRAIDKGWLVVIVNGFSLWGVTMLGIYWQRFSLLTLGSIWLLLSLVYMIGWLILQLIYDKMQNINPKI